MSFKAWLEKPVNLARLAFYGTAITPFSFAVEAASSYGPKLSILTEGVAVVAVELTPILLGGVACWYGLSRLHRGYVSDRWAEPEIEQIRAFIQSTSTKAIVIFWTLAYIGVSIPYLIERRPHHMPSPATFLLFFLGCSYVLQHLKSRFSRPTPLREPQEWSKLPRLHSEHWGQPSAR